MEMRGSLGNKGLLVLDGLEGLIVWYDKSKPGCEP